MPSSDAAARRNSVYHRSGVGECGHVVGTWPQFHIIGTPTSELLVFCRVCPKDENGIPVRVRLKIPAKAEYDEFDPDQPQPKKSPAKKTAPKKAKQLGILDQYLARVVKDG